MTAKIGTSSFRGWTLWVSTLLLVAAVGCGTDAGALGEACESAQDCEGDLVCANIDEDSDQAVCAAVEDTYPEINCRPGSDLLMPCGLVLKKAEGELCSLTTQCQSGLECSAREGESTKRCTKTEE